MPNNIQWILDNCVTRDDPRPEKDVFGLDGKLRAVTPPEPKPTSAPGWVLPTVVGEPILGPEEKPKT